MKIFFFLFVALLGISCSHDIVIVYDNDVHCHLDGYSILAGIKDSVQDLHKEVYTVSSGDFLSGQTLGNLSHGRNVIKMMNEVGYDVVTLGNHEFDYGIDTMFCRLDSLKAKVICCNFSYKGKDIYDSYCIKNDVAFIGVVTPTTITAASPKNFVDENGNYICDFYPNEICDIVQRNVNKVKEEGAKYVILLTHLGNSTNPILNSTDLIAKTYGIDAIIDAHQHSVIECDTILNVKDEPVILTSTGCYFNNVGVMTISENGKISSKLIKCESSSPKNEKIDSCYKQILSEFNRQMESQFLGTSSVDLTIMNYENSKRIVRCSETNFGDFITDAFRSTMKADIAFINAGSIRSNVERGYFNFADIYSACPFENHISVIETTGKSIIDALEMSSYKIPNESGGFLQVSGLKYEVDATIESSVIADSNGMLCIPKDCIRRVQDVKVLRNGVYKNINPDSTYKVAAPEFVLYNHGDGISFNDYKTLETSSQTDAQIIADYITDSLNGFVGQEYLRPDLRIKIRSPKRPDSKRKPGIL